MTPLTIGAMGCLAVWAALRSFPSSARTPFPGGDPALRRRLALLAAQAAAPGKSRRLRPGRPLALVGRRVPGDRGRISRLLAAAGLEDISPEAFLGERVVAAGLGALLGLRMGALAPAAVPGLALLGWWIPEAWVRRRLRCRKDQISGELAEAADLLSVCARAGLNLEPALRRVAERTPGLLGEELRRTVREIDLGVPRRRALSDLAGRSEVEELSVFVSVLLGAERFGTKVAGSLETLAAELRARRARRAEEQARRAPVKMLFPLVFLILPAFIALTVFPLLLSAFESLDF
ncbi:MAG: type II secretion system F family protein [bacterium]